MDALGFAKTTLATMIFPCAQLTGEEMLQVLGEGPCVAVCKALYDAANAGAAAGGLAERRTGVEIAHVNEKKEFRGARGLTNARQMMADGLTKPQVRQQLVEKLRRMTHALKYDPHFMAGKKGNATERKEPEQQLEDVAHDFDEANYLNDDSVPEFHREAPQGRRQR